LSKLVVHHFTDFITDTVQGWSSVIPEFSVVDFISFYIELPVMLVMTLVWLLLRRSPSPQSSPTEITPLLRSPNPQNVRKWDKYTDLVDVDTVDLNADEYEEGEQDRDDEAKREKRLSGRGKWVWRVYYALV